MRRESCFLGRDHISSCAMCGLHEGGGGGGGGGGGERVIIIIDLPL